MSSLSIMTVLKVEMEPEREAAQRAVQEEEERKRAAREREQRAHNSRQRRRQRERFIPRMLNSIE
jgi:hypothetical protein